MYLIVDQYKKTVNKLVLRIRDIGGIGDIRGIRGIGDIRDVERNVVFMY